MPLSDTITSPKAGGLGATHEKSDEVNFLVEQLKPRLEEKANVKFESLEVINYRTQTVAGRNFFVKVKAKTVDGVEEIYHLRIYQDLKRQLELTAFQRNKKLEDAVEHFQ